MRVTKRHIEAVADRIGTEFHPHRVVLFGSYAYGTPTEDSDVDLLVVMPHQKSASETAIEIMRRVQPRIPLDLIVRTPEEIRERLKWNDFFLQEISDRGQVLYESPDV
jgi:predicted nucleotidyltransferase